MEPGALTQANAAIRTGVRALNITAAGVDKESSLEKETFKTRFFGVPNLVCQKMVLGPRRMTR